MISKLFVLIFTVGLVAFVSGCWQEDLPPSQPLTEQIATVTFAAYEFDRANYEALIELFQEQHPDISVQFVPFGFLPPQEKTVSGQTLAALADTMILPPHLRTATTYFNDLTPFINASTIFSPDDFWPGILDSCGGSSVPINASADAIFYHVAAFADAGLSLPEPGWTWEDFRLTVTQLTQTSNGETVRYGFAPFSSHPVGAHPALRQLLNTRDEDNVADLAHALQWYTTWAEQGFIPDNTRGANEVLIASERVGMWTENVLAFNNWESQLEAEIGIVPFPAETAAPSGQSTPILTNCAAMSAGTTNPQAAWLWLEFLTKHHTSLLPVRQSLFAAEETVANLPSHLKPDLQFILEHGWYPPLQLQAIEIALDQTLAGEKAMTAALEDEMLSLSETSVTEAPPEGEPISVATPISEQQDDGRIIRFHSGLGTPFSTNETVKTLAEAFNLQQPEIFVEVVNDVPRSASGIISGSALAEISDCYVWFNIEDEAQLLSLEPLLEADEVDILADLWPQSDNFFRIDGQLYGLPLIISPPVIYFNADLLAAQQLFPPPPDWKFNDLIALINTAKNPDDNQYGFTLLENGGFDLSFLLPENEFQLYDLNIDPPQAYFDTPVTASSLRQLVALAEAEVMPPYEYFLSRENARNGVLRLNAIEGDKTVFWTDAGEAIEIKPWYQNGRQNIGMLPIPEGTMSPQLWVYAFQISRQTQNPAACYEWYKFLSMQPTLTDALPARLSVSNSGEWEQYLENRLRDFLRPDFESDIAEIYRLSVSRSRFPTRYDLGNRPGISVNEPLALPLEYWWRKTVNDAFAGGDIERLLVEAQFKSDIYLDCISIENAPSLDTIDSCARQADPEYSPTP